MRTKEELEAAARGWKTQTYCEREAHSVPANCAVLTASPVFASDPICRTCACMAQLTLWWLQAREAGQDAELGELAKHLDCPMTRRAALRWIQNSAL
jgi:hypothetical protein